MALKSIGGGGVVTACQSLNSPSVLSSKINFNLYLFVSLTCIENVFSFILFTVEKFIFRHSV
ncbi:unnamed protein product [Psylliodes chrysocephalus]|uniref:Uncharacterized protein n=1 Tax=Psylliodes chrysocephalus TaxID=3402493 RepID=A0A9P0G5U1_9CUCU|nr:unnamed protein product [Psylliodes chrysocephala]